MSFVDIHNTKNKYDIIYADPPWQYDDKGCQGAAEKVYPVMTVEEMAKLPVPEIAADNCVLFIWATYPKLEEVLDLIKKWGFKYKTIAFQWIKLRKNAGNLVYILPEKDCFYGLGRWTRGNSECCLIATKGKPSRVSPAVSQLIFAPLTVHSAKPQEARDKIVKLMGEDKTKIELFARNYADGWDCWGNEV